MFSLIAPRGCSLSRGTGQIIHKGACYALFSSRSLINAAKEGNVGFVTEEISDIREHYDVGGEIGVGRFATVYSASCRETGAVVAVKTLKKTNPLDLTPLRNEVAVLLRLDSLPCMMLIDTYEDDHCLHLVTEMYTGGELFDHLVRDENLLFSERDAAHIMRQVIEGLAYCHKNDVAHRDIKPENIMFKTSEPDSQLCLVDFGMSCIFNPDDISPAMRQQVGSPSYVAPEVLGGTYNHQCDMWSAGVILFILLCGEPPFHGNGPADIMRKVREGKYAMEQVEWQYVTAAGKDLVSQLMEPSPHFRLTAEEALQHEWWSEALHEVEPFSLSVLHAIRQFCSSNRFKRESITAVARALRNAPEVKKIKDIFIQFDADGSGFISRNEFGLALRSLNIATTVQELQSILSMMDADDNGKIDFDEFLSASIGEEVYMRREYLSKAFASFDLDGNGKLDQHELFEILGDQNSVLETLKQLDAEDQGFICLDDYVKFMRFVR